jgi:hypothetical protein
MRYIYICIYKYSLIYIHCVHTLAIVSVDGNADGVVTVAADWTEEGVQAAVNV